MQFERPSFALNSTDPQRAAAFYVDHLGMVVELDIGWFVSLRHPEHNSFELSVMASGHESIPRSHQVSARGVSLAVVVASVDDVGRSLESAGVSIVAGPTDHPWGQRQLLAETPDGVLLDVIQQTVPDPDWLRENGIAVD